MPKKVIESPEVSEEQQQEPILSTTHILNAVVNELVRARVRNRALISALVDNGSLEMSDYIAEYQREEEQNFGVLADLLILPRDEFQLRHNDWLRAEGERLGFVRGPHREVTLTPSEVATAQPQATLSEAEPQKPPQQKRRKR